MYRRGGRDPKTNLNCKGMGVVWQADCASLIFGIIGAKKV